MKAIYVIAIASLASWAVSAEDLAPEESPSYWDGIPTVCPVPQPNWRNTTTNLPHEYDCTKFYKCHMGKPILQDCPLMIEGDPYTRLHYNRLLQVCDWPWQAGCEDCPPQYPNNRTWPAPSKINIKPDPPNSNQYYYCSSGSKTAVPCAYGTQFSRTCQECVVTRYGGYCGGGRPWTPTIPPDPTPRPGKCINGDRKAHECDCAKYYVCYDNIDWIRFQCDGGFNFSPLRKQCVPPNEAGCTMVDEV